MEREKIAGAHEPVMRRGMMFGEVIGKIVFALGPVDEELALADAIADPVKAHVDGFGPALFDGVVGNAGGTGIVGIDPGGCLRVPEFFEGDL